MLRQEENLFRGGQHWEDWTNISKTVPKMLKILAGFYTETGTKVGVYLLVALKVKSISVLGLVLRGPAGSGQSPWLEGGSFSPHHGTLCLQGLLPELRPSRKKNSVNRRA